MKRITIHLCIGVLTFGIGLKVTSLRHYAIHPSNGTKADIHISGIPFESENLGSTGGSDTRELVLGRGLRLVPEEVKLKSEGLRYKVDLIYPQIVGTSNPAILKLNRKIKRVAMNQYAWVLSPTSIDLQYWEEKHPGVFNSVELDYEIRLASHPVLSLYFACYSYGIGAAHSVQSSFVINFDLQSGKYLKLSDLFRPHTKYREFIAHYCIDALVQKSKRPRELLSSDSLAPLTQNFESWNLTQNGILFNFDACRVFSCAEGKQAVEIPFSSLSELLRPESASYLPLTVELSSQTPNLFEDFIDAQKIDYAGFEVLKRRKKVRVEYSSQLADVEFALIRKGRRNVAKFDAFEGVYHPLGSATELGLFSFIDGKSKQLVIEQTQWRNWSYSIVDLSPVYRVIFDGSKWGVGRELTYYDIEGDGTYEISQAVLAFAFFENLTFAASHLIDITFRFDPEAREYVPANHFFESRSLSVIQSLIDALDKTDEKRYASDVLRILLHYVFAGHEAQGWSFYDREYPSANKEVIKRKVKTTLRNEPVYQNLYRKPR